MNGAGYQLLTAYALTYTRSHTHLPNVAKSTGVHGVVGSHDNRKLLATGRQSNLGIRQRRDSLEAAQVGLVAMPELATSATACACTGNQPYVSALQLLRSMTRAG